MKIRRFAGALLCALLTLSTLGPAARADEGMWPFNNVPRAEIKKRYGFDVTDAFLKHLQLASIRFNNGGSGSFVSPNGLALTNYHIVEDFVGELSTPQKDYAKVVKGYNENGKHVAPFTTLGGLYERAAEHKYQFPDNLPQRWLDRRKRRDSNTD